MSKEEFFDENNHQEDKDLQEVASNDNLTIQEDSNPETHTEEIGTPIQEDSNPETHTDEIGTPIQEDSNPETHTGKTGTPIQEDSSPETHTDEIGTPIQKDSSPETHTDKNGMPIKNDGQVTNVTHVTHPMSTNPMPVRPIKKTKKPHTALSIVMAIFTALVILGLHLSSVILISRGISYKIYDGEDQVLENKDPSNVVQPETKNQVPDISFESTPPQNATKMSASEIYQSVSPAIVGISSYKVDEKGNITNAAYGSGIVISKQGYILTNAHVLQGSEFSYRVEFANGAVIDANLVGADSISDIGLLQINGVTNLTVARIGDSSQLQPGDKVMAIGNPGGRALRNSISEGIVSGLNREIMIKNVVMSFMQVDASINPGNSGGALINEYGQVVGINSAKMSGQYEGLGFVIPMENAKPIMDELFMYGNIYSRVKLGVKITGLDKYSEHKEGEPNGLKVISIDQNSYIRDSEIKEGDVITKINNIPVDSFTQLKNILSHVKPNEDIHIQYATKESKYEETLLAVVKVSQNYNKF